MTRAPGLRRIRRSLGVRGCLASAGERGGSRSIALAAAAIGRAIRLWRRDRVGRVTGTRATRCVRFNACLSLAPSLLLSMPQLVDPNFAKTVVLLCEHAPEARSAWS